MRLRKCGKSDVENMGVDMKGGAESQTTLKTLSHFGQISPPSLLRASVCLQ